jgi:hypothetical protein
MIWEEEVWLGSRMLLRGWGEGEWATGWGLTFMLSLLPMLA